MEFKDIGNAKGKGMHIAMVSTSAFGGSATPDFASEIAKWSEGIEIAAEGPAWSNLEASALTVKRHIAGYSGVVTLHAPISDLDLAAEDDPAKRSYSLRTYRLSLQIAADLGARHVVIHSHLWSRPIKNRKKTQQLALDALCKLGLEAQELGLWVAVENVGTNGRALFSADEYIEVCTERLPGLCALLDVGHAHVNGWDIPDVIRRLGPALDALHLHDNQGAYDEHLPVGSGTIPWQEVWAALREAPGPLCLILEYGAGVDQAILREHHDLIRRQFNAEAQAVRPRMRSALLPLAG